MTVSPSQRFTKRHPCPVCGGWGGAARGVGERCYGFLSADGQYAHCTREEHSSGLAADPNGTSWAHKLGGECQCGKQHGAVSASRIVATYDYCNAAGRLVSQTVRFDPKDFKQRRPDGVGGWIWNLAGVERVLYRLPELVAAPERPVFLVEGEKDADALAALGLLATTNARGADEWRPTYADSLAGRRVVILPDNDQKGRAHAQRAAASLSGRTASIRVVALPSLPDKGDVSDWLAAGGTRAELERLVAAAPEWRPEDAADAGFAGCSIGGKPTKPESLFALTALGDLLAEPPEAVAWLVDGLLPSAGVSVIAAKPKVGKSTIARCLAYKVSRGDMFLDRATQQGPVVYLALEEKRSGVADHFRALGATDEPIYIHVGSAPEEALPALVAAITEHKPVLAVVDPLLKFCRIHDLNDYAQVSRGLEPVIALARESGCHLALVHHMGKGERAGADGILGSTALFGAVDTALLERRKEDGTRTLLSVQRYGDDLPESVVTLDKDSGLVTLAGEVATLQSEEVQRKLLEALGQDDLTQADLRERVGGNEVLTVKALHALLDAGALNRSGNGRKGNPYRYRRAVAMGDSGDSGLSGFAIVGKPASQQGNGAEHGDCCPDCGGTLDPPREGGQRYCVGCDKDAWPGQTCLPAS